VKDLRISWSLIGTEAFNTVNLEEQRAVPVEHDYMERFLASPVCSELVRMHVSSLSNFSGARVTTLRVIYSELSQWSKNTLFSFLCSYAPPDIVEEVVKIVNPQSLASVLSYIEMIYGLYGKPKLGYVIDEETGKPFIVTIVIPDCDWEAWGRIAKKIKEEIKKSNLSDLASKVAIICLKGLRGPLH